MPQIVHIEFKRRRPERFLIHWDHGEAQIFSPVTAAKYGFAPGRTFEDSEYEEIVRENGILCAKDQLLKYLGIRPHSRKELLLKTIQKGFAPAFIEAALSDLERVDLINDEKFARQFIENELLLRPAGKHLLKEKLLQRGVSSKIFEPILEEIFRKQPPEDIIRKITRKFLNKNQNLPAKKRTEKLVRHLQSKGFGWDLINQALYEENIIDSVE
jgi:regulatory protein